MYQFTYFILEMDYDILLFYGADVALVLAGGTLLGKIIHTKSSAGKIVWALDYLSTRPIKL